MTTRSAEQAVTAKKILIFAAITSVLLSPLVVWYLSVGPDQYFGRYYVTAGQTVYVLSKLCGLLALVSFWFQGMTALARFSPRLKGFLQLRRGQHIALGIGTLLLVVMHITLFLIASWFRTEHFTLDPLAPKFNQGYFVAYISLGALAFWTLLLAVFAGVRRLKAHLWSAWIHRLVFLAFALAFLHGMSIGSETRFGLMAYVYAFIGLSLGTATCSAVIAVWKRRAAGGRIATVESLATTSVARNIEI